MGKFFNCDGVTGINTEAVSFIRVYKDTENDKFIVIFHGNFSSKDGGPAYLGTKTFDSKEARDAFLKDTFDLEGEWEDKAPERGRGPGQGQGRGPNRGPGTPPPPPRRRNDDDFDDDDE